MLWFIGKFLGCAENIIILEEFKPREYWVSDYVVKIICFFGKDVNYVRWFNLCFGVIYVQGN